MWNAVTRFIDKHYARIINSIAFYPAFIAILFLILSYGMITFDFSETGTDLKENWKWLRLQDASTARSVSSSIAAGIISLTVFSFTMVMVVLNQAGSNTTNRVLDKLIGNRFQQIVLGIYIGTIVYALFLLSTIRDIDSGVHIASLSTYLLIVITIFDIFLFIYFLHYITKSIKVNVIVQRIYKQTQASLEKSCMTQQEPEGSVSLDVKTVVTARHAGLFNGFRQTNLLRLCDEHDCMVEVIVQSGTFVMQNTPVMNINKEVSQEVAAIFLQELSIVDSDDIQENYFYGCQQLTELAVRALSPGINDPGSAIIGLRSLFLLYQYRAKHSPQQVIYNERRDPRVLLHPLTFQEVFERTLLPIWDYGKNDRLLRKELHGLLVQFRINLNIACVEELFAEIQTHDQTCE